MYNNNNNKGGMHMWYNVREAWWQGSKQTITPRLQTFFGLKHCYVCECHDERQSWSKLLQLTHGVVQWTNRIMTNNSWITPPKRLC